MSEKIKYCFVKLLESNQIQEKFPKVMKSIISEQLERLRRYKESEILLDIFHRASEKDLNGCLTSWYNHYPIRNNEFIYKIFDGVRMLQHLTKFEEDFETQAIVILSSFQILLETYYRRLISFLLDLLEIIEGRNPNQRIRFIGESYREFMENYREKYPIVEIFFSEIIKNIRNSAAHADYEINVESREIIIKDRGRILHQLNEDEINKVFEYLIKMINISIHFYWYSLLHFAEKLNFWNSIFEELNNPKPSNTTH